MKKSALIILVVFVVVIIYLNRSYVYFYDFQGSHKSPIRLYPSSQELKTNKSTKELNIVVLGDSLMAGDCVNTNSNTLAYQIAQSYSKPNQNVRLINLAKAGVGISDVSQRQLSEALSTREDYIFIMIGINDMHNLVKPGDFRKQYTNVLKNIASLSSAKVILINIPYLGSDKTLLPPWNYFIDLRTRQFNQIIAEANRQTHFQIIDVYSKFKDNFVKSSDLYCQDQFHPSEKGYQVLGAYINASTN